MVAEGQSTQCRSSLVGIASDEDRVREKRQRIVCGDLGHGYRIYDRLIATAQATSRIALLPVARNAKAELRDLP
ncbi:hypothetical protein [Nocardia fluminea]|uniref:hypothetical protein n=1 Tax=Nocardia fluminea TaxID=134984 RepID=UPI003D1117BE